MWKRISIFAQWNHDIDLPLKCEWNGFRFISFKLLILSFLFNSNLITLRLTFISNSSWAQSSRIKWNFPWNSSIQCFNLTKWIRWKVFFLWVNFIFDSFYLSALNITMYITIVILQLLYYNMFSFGFLFFMKINTHYLYYVWFLFLYFIIIYIYYYHTHLVWSHLFITIKLF